MKKRLTTALAAALLLLLAPIALAGGGPAETVVLLNRRSADSKAVADHYVKARDIPPQNVCEVDCEPGLTVPMEDFTRDVVDPLRRFLRTRKLEEQCRFIVLTQGMPIRARTLRGGFVSTAAALALLDTPRCGATQPRVPRAGLHEPVYRSGVAPEGEVAFGGRYYLVTALISTTADEAKALVDRSVASDGTAPKKALFSFQDAAGNAKVRNARYDASRAKLEALGHLTEHEPAGGDKVNGRKRLMGVMSGGSYSKLTVKGVETNQYLPGAICDMLQSFGAVPENFTPDHKGKQFPITHLIRAGITGVHGAVAEPYAHTFPNTDLFLPYAKGFTLAESFHQSLPFSYWMNLVIGDPLCAPYADRPTIALRVNGKTPGRDLTVTDRFEVEVAAPGAARTELFIDGRQVGVADADRLVFEAVPGNGTHQLLAQATAGDEAESRGWSAVTFTFRGADPPSVPDPPAGAPPVKLLAEAPGQVAAGDAFEIAVRPTDANGKDAPGAHYVEVRSRKPTRRFAAVEAAGAIKVPLRLIRAGTMHFDVSAPDAKLTESVTVEVRPAPPHHATTPLSVVPLGHVIDVPVHVEDQFGNRVLDWKGTLSLAIPGDPHARIPGPQVVKVGTAVFRDVLLTKPGRHALVIKDGNGKTWSQQGEGVAAQPTGVRAWLLGAPRSGADGKTLLSGDAGATATSDGAVALGTLFRKHASSRDEVRFNESGAKNGDVAAAVAEIEMLSAAKVRLLAAAPDDLRVLVDGKQVFSGAPKATAPAKKPQPIADVKLSEGRHVITVTAVRKGRFSFALKIDDGKGKHPAALRVVRRSGTPAAGELAVSGRVLRTGGRPVGFARVDVVVAGKARTTTTAPDGGWWIGGLPAGEALVRPRGGEFSPKERRVKLEGAHAVGIDFRHVQKDRGPPTVRLKGLSRNGLLKKPTQVEALAKDDVGVASVSFVLDGKPLRADTSGKHPSVRLDPKSIGSGKHVLEAVATDLDGKETRATLEFRVR